MFQQVWTRIGSSQYFRWLAGGVACYFAICCFDFLVLSDHLGRSSHGILMNAAQAAVPFTRLPQVSADQQAATGNEVQTVSVMLPNGIQQIVVHDTRSQRMAVYHVEGGSGRIQLKSVRDLTWDLKMEHFNGQSPLPSELKQMQP